MLQTISASGAPEDAPACPEPQFNEAAVLTVLVVGTFLAPLDSSIVNIALPSIADQFGIAPATVSWVATAYLLTSAALLLSMGRLGDLWGLRRLYVLGLAVFGVGSLACALSPSIAALIASRVLQASGASMIFAAGPALVARTFPANRRGRALGYVTLAVSAGLTVGPSLGGLLLAAFGWPSMFLINVPLSAGVAVLAWRLLPDECPRKESFDLVGAVLSGVALLALLLSLTATESAPILSLPVLGGLAVAVAAFVAFVYAERHHERPMIDLHLFRSKPFSLGILAATLAYLALFSVTFNMPFYLLRVRGMDPRSAGLLLTALPLAMALVAPLAGRIADKEGSRYPATAGALTLAVGLIGLSFVGRTTPLYLVPLGTALLGAGMGFFQTPNTTSVLRATPRERAGVGSAMIAEARNVGMAVGIALTAAIVTAYLGGPLGGGHETMPAAQATDFVRGMSMALRIAGALAVTTAALAWSRSASVVEAPTGKP